MIYHLLTEIGDLFGWSVFRSEIDEFLEEGVIMSPCIQENLTEGAIKVRFGRTLGDDLLKLEVQECTKDLEKVDHVVPE